jgi:hypothetical protein
MNSTVTDSGQRVGWVTAACWLLPGLLNFASRMDTPDGRLLGNVASLLFAPLFIILALAVGDWLLDVVLRLHGPFAGRKAFAAGLGLGALSLDAFLIGSIVIPPAPVAWASAALIAALLAKRTGRLLAELHESVRAFCVSRDWLQYALAIIIIVLAALNVLRSYVPPIEYDEMEYHLAAPARYVRDGHVGAIEDNAYAAFPANVEMLFLDAMILRGGVVEGFALSRLINVALGLLAAAAMGACAAAIFDRHAALPAAAIFLTWPRISSITSVGYVELGLMLYVALAILAAWQYRKSGRDLRHLALLGIVCGLAAGCKYPALLFLCVPAGVWVLTVAGRRCIAHAAMLTGLVLLLMSPWLIRNTIHTGNPVHPLLGERLGSRDWSPRKEARWVAAHSPGEFSLSETPPALSLSLFVFLPFVFFRREWRSAAGVFLLLVALVVVGWLLLTHNIPRFLIPWLVPLVLVNAAGAVAARGKGAFRVTLAVVLVALCAVHAGVAILARAPGGKVAGLGGVLSTEVEFALGVYGIDEAVWGMSAHSNYHHRATEFINSRAARGRTLFYGEALTLYATAGVIAPTVFDENPLDRIVHAAASGQDVADRLLAMGVAHVYVNLPELKRLQRTYSFKQGGREWRGYCTLTQPAEFDRVFEFLNTRCRIVYPTLPPLAESRANGEVVRTMRDGKPSNNAKPYMNFIVYEIQPR